MDAEAMSAELSALVGKEQVLAGTSVARVYDCDAYTIDRSSPTVVTLPRSTQEAQTIVRWCAKNQIPFTPRGAGTGLSGGAMPALGGVVISTKRMTSILEVDIANRRLHAEAGVANAAISKAVATNGLHFAPDPSSQAVSTLGGNIAENAGGPHTLKYGVTAPHILGLTMIEPDGNILTIDPGPTNSPGPDWTSLIVGGEGTFGLVTQAWVKLTPIPSVIRTFLAAFKTIRDATECVSAIIATGVVPAALEMMDANILVALKAAFGLEYPEGTAALLLVECDGELSEVETECAEVLACFARTSAMDVRQAADEAERQHLWTARKKGVGAMGRLAPTIVTHDGVIPRSKLPEMLETVYAVAAEHQIGVANLFHAGDGNLHPCFYFDDRDPRQVEAVVQAGETIIRRCIELGGSVTGEHGIGVEKADLMSVMFSPQDLDVQMRIKGIFNPNSTCNPCKIFPNQKGCVEHMRRWRGIAW
ncbi:MAG: FAD-binding protein [Armatimonadetes bacterium]|nr:FAD-binding protein [Armatimonadota bacterium]